MPKNRIEFSIVVPVFNEADNLIPLRDNIVDAMQCMNVPYEVILVNDGSTDRSQAVIEEICRSDNRFRFLRFDRNHGQTAAFDAGFKASRGTVIITMDADMQTDAHDIPLMTEKLADYDAVVGFRKKRADNLIKKISSRIANSVRNTLSGENIRDTGCPLKAIRREALQHVKLYKGMHRFFPTLLKLEGYSVVEVPVNHYPRKYGVSKYNIWNRVFRATRDLLVVRWMKDRSLNYRIVESKDP